MTDVLLELVLVLVVSVLDICALLFPVLAPRRLARGGDAVFTRPSRAAANVRGRGKTRPARRAPTYVPISSQETP